MRAGEVAEAVHHIGLDLGKRRDHSAIAVVERVEYRYAYGGGERGPACVRYLERVPLGTPYPEVVAQVREIARWRGLAGDCALVVDATGVGAPVVEMLEQARLGCEVHAVTLTAGGHESSRHSGGITWHNVPKNDLFGELLVLLERHELRLPKRLKETGPLVRELSDIRMTRTETGGARLGADQHGQHDDLAIALALALWKGRKEAPPLWGRQRVV